MNIITKKVYIIKLLIIILPVTLGLVWLFFVPFINEQAFNVSNDAFIKFLVIPISLAIVWAIFWQLIFYKSLLEYEKDRKRKQLSNVYFSEHEVKIVINDVLHHLVSCKFDVINEQTYYRHRIVKGSDSDTNEYTFVRFEKAEDSVKETFDRVVLDHEPFKDAYEQRIMDSHYKYVIMIATDFFDYEKRAIEKKCIDWKVQSMRFSGKMPNDFWLPIIYIPNENKLYFLDYMSKIKSVKKLLGVNFK
jgi:cellulose biosynthesis protein BcsQ